MLKKTGIIFLICSVFALQAQKKANPERLKQDAEFFIQEGEHEKAYQVYNQLIETDTLNYLYKFQKGLSALHLPFRKAETIGIFDNILKTDKKYKRDLISYLAKKYENVPTYYLGRAYHSNYKFDEAIGYFKDFLATRPGDLNIKQEAEHYLNFAESGRQLVERPIKVNILHIGAPLNTPAHEYVPLITADESMMFFTYRGPKSIGGLMNQNGKPNKNGIYFEDIYFSKKTGDTTWSEPQSIGDDINTKQHDACIAISADGQDLYTYRSGEKDGGDIYVCHLNGEKWSNPERLGPNINTTFWEGSCSVTSDGRYLYFASERNGGMGGRDIYVAEKLRNGNWGAAKNLWAINTKFDDDAPFIHPDGTTLFFSSQGHNSMGGYDIFYSNDSLGLWTKPVNMGYPLNTTDDDRYYVINAKGDKGYFSSNRDIKGGDGSQEIYTVKPGWYAGKQHALAMVVGRIFGNDSIIEAKIEVVKKSNGEVLGPIHSNSVSGKYLIALPPKEDYLFKVSAPGYTEYSEDMNAEQLIGFIEVDKDFHLCKENYKDPHLDTLKKLNDFMPRQHSDTLQPVQVALVDTTTKVNTVAATAASPCDALRTIDFSALKGKSLNDPSVYAKLLEIGNSICAGNMVFKVQVGAFRKAENFRGGHLKAFGQSERILGADGITRFTMGKCDNVSEAETLRQKIIGSGQKDAWITAVVDGKRYTLEELIMVDFYNKNISHYEENLEQLEELICNSR
ncbi:MAG: hypothetical protein ACJ76F_06440 [Bacteroidia bacterium]